MKQSPVTFFVSTPDRFGEIISENENKYVTKLHTFLDSSNILEEKVSVLAVTQSPQSLSALHRVLSNFYPQILRDLEDNLDAFTYLKDY